MRRRLFRLAWPSVLENFLQTGIFMLNTALAGRLSAEALSAAGISNFLMFFTFTLFLGLSIGTLAQVARAVGARDYADARKVAWHGLAASIAASVLITAVVLALAPQLLTLIGAPDEIVRLGAPYIRASMLLAPVHALMVSLSAVLRGAGDTRSPMVASLLMMLTNGALGYLLVFGGLGIEGMGLVGLAIAFNVARVVAAAHLGLVVWRSALREALWQGTAVDRATLRRVIRVGLPAAAEQGIAMGGVMMFSIIGLSLGAVSFAAQNVTTAVLSLSFSISFGMSVAASTAVGQSLGAGAPELARRFGREAALGATLLSALVGLLIFLLPGQLAQAFTDDPAVIETAELPLRIMGLMVPLQGPAVAFPGALRGAGDTRATMVIAILAMWIVRLPVALIFGIALNLGLTGIWLGSGADFAARGLTSYMRFRSGKWQQARV